MKIEDRQQTEINNPRPARLSKRSLRIRNRVLMIVTAVLSLLLLVVLFLFTSGIAGGITPQLPSDIMVSLRRENSGWHAFWNASETATSYRVELFSGKDAEGQAVYDEETETAECMLPADLPEQTPLTLRITPRRTYKMLGLSVRTVDGLPLQLTSSFRVPERYTPEWRVDPEKRTLTVCCSGGADDVYHLYLMSKLFLKVHRSGLLSSLFFSDEAFQLFAGARYLRTDSIRVRAHHFSDLFAFVA
jgi:hypothetical protein